MMSSERESVSCTSGEGIDDEVPDAREARLDRGRLLDRGRTGEPPGLQGRWPRHRACARHSSSRTCLAMRSRSIQERKLRVRDTTAIERDGKKHRRRASKRLLVGIRDRLKVDLAGGGEWTIKGKFADHEYEIKGDHRTVATISKKWVPRARHLRRRRRRGSGRRADPGGLGRRRSPHRDRRSGAATRTGGCARSVCPDERTFTMTAPEPNPTAAMPSAADHPHPWTLTPRM